MRPCCCPRRPFPLSRQRPLAPMSPHTSGWGPECTCVQTGHRRAALAIPFHLHRQHPSAATSPHAIGRGPRAPRVRLRHLRAALAVLLHLHPEQAVSGNFPSRHCVGPRVYISPAASPAGWLAVPPLFAQQQPFSGISPSRHCVGPASTSVRLRHWRAASPSLHPFFASSPLRRCRPMVRRGRGFACAGRRHEGAQPGARAPPVVQAAQAAGPHDSDLSSLSLSLSLSISVSRRASLWPTMLC
jgi:hypothetical protein